MKKLTLENFIERSNKIHDNKYDYSISEYINTNEKISIICRKHGVFIQTAGEHLRGNGCSVCSGTKKQTLLEFIKKANEIHKNRYDYSLAEYINSHNTLKIKCLTHGIFEQIARNHLKGYGCPECSHSKKKTLEEFKSQAIKIHNNRFDYSESIYINKKTNIIIICKKHGKFEQKPYVHLKGHGCPMCRESKGEIKIREFLTEKKIKFTRQKTFEKCVFKRKLKFDFYLPSFNLCIEFNGQQHYDSYERFGGLNTLKKLQKYDSIKKEFCLKDNPKLLIIKYNENILEKIKDYFDKNNWTI